MFVPREDQDRNRWDRIVGFYQVLAQQFWSPVVALNRALALAERDGVDAGRRELVALAGEPKLSRYPFYWAARADLERRAGRHTAARENYQRHCAGPEPGRAGVLPAADREPGDLLARVRFRRRRIVVPLEAHPMRPGETQ